MCAGSSATLLNPVMSKNSDRERLLEILADKSLTYKDVTLSSGEKSTVYVDAKLTTCRPQAMPLIGKLFLDKMEQLGWHVDAAGGLTVGADPIAFAVARESLGRADRIQAFIIRKEPKSHGLEKYVEGIEDTKDCRVIILDDVCTKGGSTGKAIDRARAAGMIVIGAICLVDREQGATELLAGMGVRLESIFRLNDLISQKSKSQPIPAHA
jgi:orotate phosphoribosyltransferase